jgi:hypothetical protein
MPSFCFIIIKVMIACQQSNHVGLGGTVVGTVVCHILAPGRESSIQRSESERECGVGCCAAYLKGVLYAVSGAGAVRSADGRSRRGELRGRPGAGSARLLQQSVGGLGPLCETYIHGLAQKGRSGDSPVHYHCDLVITVKYIPHVETRRNQRSSSLRLA